MARRMTEYEQQIHTWLIDYVLRPNHPLFANHLQDYDIHLTDDPGVIARVFPRTGIIEINPNRVEDEVSLTMFVIHELMHLIFKHEQNGIKWIAPFYDIDPHKMNKNQYEFLLNKLYTAKFIPTISAYEDGTKKYGDVTIMNVAGDWDLSRYLTPEEQEAAKKIGGLLLELDHPEMKDMTYMELMDCIADWEREYRRKSAKVIDGNLKNKTTFIRDPEPET